MEFVKAGVATFALPAIKAIVGASGSPSRRGAGRAGRPAAGKSRGGGGVPPLQQLYQRRCYGHHPVMAVRQVTSIRSIVASSGDGGAGDDIVALQSTNNGDPVALAGGTGIDTLRLADLQAITTSTISGFERLEATASGNGGAILATLSAYGNLIENNRRRIALLEEAA